MKEEAFLKNVENCIGKSSNAEQVAEDLITIDCTDTHSFSNNGQVLARYISSFQFDWDNEVYDDEKTKLSETIEKIKQILNDTKNGNLYHSVFSVDLAYSRLVGGDYQYKIINQKLRAENVAQAESETGDMRRDLKKAHPKDSSFTLEDVRIHEQIIDHKGNSIIDRVDTEL